MSNALLRRLTALEKAASEQFHGDIHYCTVTRGNDGILRDFATGAVVTDGPTVPGVPCGEFRFLTELGQVDLDG